MIYKQCKFMNVEDTAELDLEKGIRLSTVFYGIAVYDDHCQGDAAIADLVGVICGHCGHFLPADECVVLQTLDAWWDISEAISNNFTPDDIRGFRV